ncbi:VOC family protein [Nocardia sp. NPDC051570]|uniref:VOC family protein n=1 Tax=Nocardia sp. NPDC051570 TaxID=3364324 RepID=UPI00379456C3
MPIMLPSYHIGIVVADLRQAMAEFGKIGLEWHAPVRNESDLIVGGEKVPYSTWMTYSKQGPAYLELLQQSPGTIWAETGLHHLGLWVDDVPAESEHLTAEGIPLLQQAYDKVVDAPFSYHQTSDGIRLELMDIGHVGPGLATYLSGAADDYLNGIATAGLDGVSEG